MNSTTLPKSAWLELPETVVVPLEVGRAILKAEQVMNEQECLSKMVAPGTHRPGKYRDGVIQIHVTRVCDKSCFNCTQGSNLRHVGKPEFISLEHFEQAVLSLKSYWGVVGVFGGNPATHPQFSDLCSILTKHIPFEQRGLWCNNPISGANAVAMRRTFDPTVSNLNVHLDEQAYGMFQTYWPESRPFGLIDDSRHSPCYVAMKDILRIRCDRCDGVGIQENPISPCTECNGTGVMYNESLAWELISDCDINKHWSAMIGVFRGELRAWFCEIAGAQAMLHQHEPNYPDTGLELANDYVRGDNPPYEKIEWWQLSMQSFSEQVRQHCHDCGVPLRGYGELAQGESGREQVSQTHENIFRSKTKGRRIELVTVREQLGKELPRMTNYLQNAKV